MRIITKLKKALCKHNYVYANSHLIGMCFRCTKCGNIVQLSDYINNLTKSKR